MIKTFRRINWSVLALDVHIFLWWAPSGGQSRIREEGNSNELKKSEKTAKNGNIAKDIKDWLSVLLKIDAENQVSRATINFKIERNLYSSMKVFSTFNLTLGEDTLTWTIIGANEVLMSCPGWLMVSASKTTSCRALASSKILSISLCTSAAGRQKHTAAQGWNGKRRRKTFHLSQQALGRRAHHWVKHFL